MKTRLPTQASTFDDMLQYYQTRARQLHHEGIILDDVLQPEKDVAHAFFHDIYSEQRYQSIFIPKHKSGFGLFAKYYDPNLSILTMHECHLIAFLQKHSLAYRVAGQQLETMEEYHVVSQFYGNQYAQRTRMFLMNHIDEGISILRDIHASEGTIRAYCIHPLLQMDKECGENLAFLSRQLQHDSASYVIALAMEYRLTANRYLSHCTMPAGGIILSPLKEVNDMLIADKVQNAKDFDRYHRGTHPNSDRLVAYFQEWHDALGVTANMYQRWKETLPYFSEDSR